MTQKALITGATGFIGGRLAARLTLGGETSVRALVRHYRRAARLSRFANLEMVRGDIVDAEAVDRAVEGCEVVYHCAHDLKDASRNVESVAVLADACRRHGVRRFVHLSSISVYEPLQDGDLDETVVPEPSGFAYGDLKLEVEREVLAQAEQGLPAFLLLPTIVYGPFGGAWTHGPVEQLLSGTVVLPDRGEGFCNPVYVDDVCDAMVLASEASGVEGRRYLVSGPEPVAWREFFERYAAVFGVSNIEYMPADEIERRHRSLTSQVGEAVVNPRRLMHWPMFKPLTRYLQRNLPQKTKLQILGWIDQYRKVAAPNPVHLPPPEVLSLFQSRCRVRIDRAREEIGYAPTYDFDRGMDLTAKYLRWAYPESAAPNGAAGNGAAGNGDGAASNGDGAAG